MNILLTNDDGIESPGLRALEESLSREHTVYVVAPDGERSGMSHYITMKLPVRAQKKGERRLAVSGSPADCVILALHGAIGVRPDVVISGPNLGANLGTDVVYSGTVAAARQAAFAGVPGIALSVDSYRPPWHFSPIVEFIRDHVDEIIGLWTPDHFLNINAANDSEGRMPVRLTTLGRRTYRDQLFEYEAPSGDKYFFLDGEPDDSAVHADSDVSFVKAGGIAMTPVAIYPNEQSDFSRYEGASFLQR